MSFRVKEFIQGALNQFNTKLFKTLPHTTTTFFKNIAFDPRPGCLTSLTYERIKNKNEACRSHVSRCSSLREIVITGEESAIRSNKIMTVVMKAKNSLTRINLSPSFAGLSNSSFEKIGEMTQLTHLAVGGGKLESGGISALACLTELKTLKIPKIACKNNNVVPVLVDLFSKLKKLEQVEIVKMKVLSDEVVKSLVNNNPNFHHLDITTCGHVDFIDSSFLDYHNFCIDGFSSRSIILIADKCPQLTHIGIGHLWNVSDVSITKLVENCPKLKHADFRDTRFNDTALAMMSKNCLDLEYLNIFDCINVTEEALERFANPATTANLKKLCIGKYTEDYGPQFADRSKQNLPHVEIVIKY